VLDLCGEHGIPCDERDISMTEVYRADEVFCTGTMGELAAVTRVDGRTIGTGNVGPVTERLSGLYTELTATTGETVV
jgi:branched-chain amino acid aminotransferase